MSITFTIAIRSIITIAIYYLLLSSQNRAEHFCAVIVLYEESKSIVKVEFLKNINAQ